MALRRHIGPSSGFNIALVTGVAWSLQRAVSVVIPDPTWVLDVTMIVPMILTFFAVRLFLNPQSAGTSRLGRIRLAAMVITTVAAVPGQPGAAAERS